MRVWRNEPVWVSNNASRYCAPASIASLRYRLRVARVQSGYPCRFKDVKIKYAGMAERTHMGEQ